MIDLYCERLAPGLFGEPLNVLSNAGFFIAAIVCLRQARNAGADVPPLRVLIALVLAISIGSTLFHMVAERWAELADRIPILLFQLWFLWLYARHVMRARALPVALFILAYTGIALYSGQFAHLFNGSIIYAPAIAVLIALAVYHERLGHRDRHVLVYAAAAFLIALAFRTADAALCELFPGGTHFVWHVMNSVVLYLSIRALIEAHRREVHAAARNTTQAPAMAAANPSRRM